MFHGPAAAPGPMSDWRRGVCGGPIRRLSSGWWGTVDPLMQRRPVSSTSVHPSGHAAGYRALVRSSPGGELPQLPRELTCQRPPGVPRSQTSAELVRREGKPPTAQPNRTLVTDSEISLIQPMPLRRLVTGGARGSMGRSRGRLLGRGRPEPCNGSPVRQRGRHSRIDASLRRRDRDSAGASRRFSLRRGAAAELRSSATSHVQLCDHRVLDEGRRSSSPCTGVLDRSQCLVAPQPAPLGISPAPHDRPARRRGRIAVSAATTPVRGRRKRGY